MQDLEVKRMLMFIKVVQFFKTHAAFFQSPFVKEQSAMVEDAVKDLEEHSSNQISGNAAARRSSSSKAALRNELREDMALISRIARSIALLNPGFDDEFRMPRPGTDQLLLSTARTFATKVTKFSDEFAKREMPAGFLENFQANIDGLKNAVAEKALGRSVQVGATALIDDAIERGMNAVRQLDPIARIKFADDPGALAEWLSSSRTERVPRQTQQPEAPIPQPPTPQA